MNKIYTFTKYTLIILILLVHSNLIACYADFSYDNSNNNGVVIFTGTSEYTSNPAYTWHLGDGQIALGENYTHTFTYSGEYTVCLSVSDDSGCSDIICNTISVNNISSTNCPLNDCVYPGDTNKDGSANIYDIFSIGMHYGDIGPVRNNANDGWYGQPAQDWDLYCIGGNLKHTDCNGDGVVNSADLDPILSNYYNDHSYQSYPTPSPNTTEVALEFSSDSIIVDSENPGLINVSLDIFLGSAANPADDIYALAFSLEFLDDLVDPSNVSIEYNTESFFCDPENLLFLSKTTEDGIIDIGLSRTNNIPVSGHGRIARVNFTIIGDIVLNRSDDGELPLMVDVHNIHGINDGATYLNFSSHGDLMTFNIDNFISIKEDINPNLFSISPNPSTGILQLETEAYQISEFKVYNTTGQLLIQKNNLYNFHQLDLSHLPNGTYFIKVNSDDETATKRIVISK